jgi:TatA/E family protein of Tat protein translocase
MPDIGPLELIIVAVVVLLLFGPGKAADLGASLGKGIREFRRESRSDPAPEASRSCATCGGAIAASQRFCTSCGSPVATAS